VIGVLEDGDQEKSRTSEGEKVSGRRLSVVCGRKNLLDRINRIHRIEMGIKVNGIRYKV
jgi:hypothetical protein